MKTLDVLKYLMMFNCLDVSSLSTFSYSEESIFTWAGVIHERCHLSAGLCRAERGVMGDQMDDASTFTSVRTEKLQPSQLLFFLQLAISYCSCVLTKVFATSGTTLTPQCKMKQVWFWCHLCSSVCIRRHGFGCPVLSVFTAPSVSTATSGAVTLLP